MAGRNPSHTAYSGDKHVLPTEERRSVCMLESNRAGTVPEAVESFYFSRRDLPKTSVTDFYSAVTVLLIRFVSPLLHSPDVSNTPKLPWTAYIRWYVLFVPIAAKVELKLKTCNSCKDIKYCSVTCQKNHWPKHKQECKQRAARLRDESLFKQPPP